MSTVLLGDWLATADALLTEADEAWFEAQCWRRRARLAASGVALPRQRAASQERAAGFEDRASKLVRQAQAAWNQAQLMHASCMHKLTMMTDVMEVRDAH